MVKSLGSVRPPLSEQEKTAKLVRSIFRLRDHCAPHVPAPGKWPEHPEEYEAHGYSMACRDALQAMKMAGFITEFNTEHAVLPSGQKVMKDG